MDKIFNNLIRMLNPRKTKFQKYFKPQFYGLSNSKIEYGFYGIQAINYGRITSNQIESSRRVLSRFMKRQGNFWIRIFPHFPLTKKPNETRMGRGKGNVSIWYANVKANQILFEFDSIDYSLALHLSSIISSKLPIKVKLISKTQMPVEVSKFKI